MESTAANPIKPIDIIITRTQPTSAPVPPSPHSPAKPSSSLGMKLESLQSANSLPVVRARVSDASSRPALSTYSRSISPPTRSPTLSVLRIGSPSVLPSHTQPLPPPPPTFHRCFFHPVPVLSRASSPSRARAVSVAFSGKGSGPSPTPHLQSSSANPSPSSSRPHTSESSVSISHAPPRPLPFVAASDKGHMQRGLTTREHIAQILLHSQEDGAKHVTHVAKPSSLIAKVDADSDASCQLVDSSLPAPKHSSFLLQSNKISSPPPSTLPIVDLSDAMQVPMKQTAPSQEVHRASYARSLSMIVPQKSDAGTARHDHYLSPAQKQQQSHNAESHSNTSWLFGEYSLLSDLGSNYSVQRQASLRSPGKQQQQQQNQQKQKQKQKQKQQQQQNRIHTIFLNAPLTSKLHTAPPSTPFSSLSTCSAPRTPMLIHDVRHELKQAFSASSNVQSSRVVHIPIVARLRSSALADPVLNRALTDEAIDSVAGEPENNMGISDDAEGYDALAGPAVVRLQLR